VFPSITPVLSDCILILVIRCDKERRENQRNTIHLFKQCFNHLVNRTTFLVIWSSCELSKWLVVFENENVFENKGHLVVGTTFFFWNGGGSIVEGFILCSDFGFSLWEELFVQWKNYFHLFFYRI